MKIFAIIIITKVDENRSSEQCKKTASLTKRFEVYQIENNLYHRGPHGRGKNHRITTDEKQIKSLCVFRRRLVLGCAPVPNNGRNEEDGAAKYLFFASTVYPLFRLSKHCFLLGTA